MHEEINDSFMEVTDYGFAENTEQGFHRWDPRSPWQSAFSYTE